MILIEISIGIFIAAAVLTLFGVAGLYVLGSKLDNFMKKLVIGGLLPIGLVLFFVGVILLLKGI